MFSIFILLLGAQFFSDSLSQPDDSFKNLSRQFTSKNYSIALFKFRKQLFSSNILQNYNISMTNSFYQGNGNIYIHHYNETYHVNDILLRFDIIMVFKNNRSSYTSRVHHLCLFASSCNQSFIKDWIKWQKIAINKTKQSEAIFSSNNVNYIEFKIWSLSYHNITELCFHITTDQNENRNTHTPNIKVNDTNNCSRHGYTYENIRHNISTRVIELIDFVQQYQYLNIKKHVIGQTFTTTVNIPPTDTSTPSLVNINQSLTRELTTTMINQNKSSNKNLRHILIFVLIIVLSIILLAIFIVCLIYWNNYRHGYRPTATS